MVVSGSVVPHIVVVIMLGCVVQLASAQQFQQCTYTDPTTGKSYDLTPLAQQFTTKASESAEGHPPAACLALSYPFECQLTAGAGRYTDALGYAYLNSPCQNVQGQPECMGNPTVCQLNPSGSYVLGSMSTATSAMPAQASDSS
jgi:hypothetical protein